MLLSTSVMWLATKYLFQKKTFHWIASIPATVGTAVTVSYIMTAAIGLNLPQTTSQPIGIVVGILCLIALVIFHKKEY